MKSRTTDRFKAAYRKLPTEVKGAAKAAFRQWSRNPFAKGLHFERIKRRENYYSVRIGIHWRALASLADDGAVVWFWIGHLAEYDRVLRMLWPAQSDLFVDADELAVELACRARPGADQQHGLEVGALRHASLGS